MGCPDLGAICIIICCLVEGIGTKSLSANGGCCDGGNCLSSKCEEGGVRNITNRLYRHIGYNHKDLYVKTNFLFDMKVA